MQAQPDVNGQYSLRKIMLIWLVGGAPMWILGWLVHPALSEGMDQGDAGMLRLWLMTAGLAWQFVLSLWIVRREEGNLAPRTIAKRFWLNHPISPQTGQTSKRLWWWIVPLFAFVAAWQVGLSAPVSALWLRMFPFLSAPEGLDASALFATPEARAQWLGAWNLLVAFTALAVFNTFLGEEFLFRGVLLPKMKGVFGGWSWVANGALFALYHLHQPWMILSGLFSAIVFAYAGERFKCNWLPIILHSGQSVFFVFVILAVILGLA